jgi:hypothetical protein
LLPKGIEGGSQDKKGNLEFKTLWGNGMNVFGQHGISFFGSPRPYATVRILAVRAWILSISPSPLDKNESPFHSSVTEQLVCGFAFLFSSCPRGKIANIFTGIDRF